MPYCTVCGDPIGKASRFCTRCGAPAGEKGVQPPSVTGSHTGERYVVGDGQPPMWIPAQRTGDGTTTIGLTHNGGVMVVLDAKPVGQRFEFELAPGQEAILGRDATVCALALPDDRTSRQHCAIGCDDSRRLYVRDLGSSNGTIVDGAKISGATILTVGSVVRVGSSTLTVTLLT